MQRINVRLPDKLLAALETRAEEESIDISKVTRKILSESLGVADTEELDEKENPELPI